MEKLILLTFNLKFKKNKKYIFFIFIKKKKMNDPDR
jgi:hypothetical protein